MNHQKEVLRTRFEACDACVAIVGLGYVGLPLAVAFAERGFKVIGIDVSERKVKMLNSGISYVQDIPSLRLGRACASGRLSATTRFEGVSESDAVIICVPTPLNKTRDPDMRYLLDAGSKVARNLREGALVCLESTTYPGTTEELILPMIQKGGGEVGRDFFLAFSPERIDPGRKDFTVEKTPKVVGGVTGTCCELACLLYAQIIDRVVPVSSSRTAEMVKLLENTFRAVNIGLVNEVAIMCDKLGIDVWEVVDAAATKPYGFMKFAPGPGVGGHCIPLDPHYLSWKLKTLNYNARFIQLAGEINSGMPHYWVGKVQDALNSVGKAMRGSRVLVIGVAYKKDIDDVRESPALDIIELLKKKGADVTYHDPFVPRVAVNGYRLASVPRLDDALAQADCSVIVTDHSDYDYRQILDQSALLVDTRNVTQDLARMREGERVSA